MNSRYDNSILYLGSLTFNFVYPVENQFFINVEGLSLHLMK